MLDFQTVMLRMFKRVSVDIRTRGLMVVLLVAAVIKLAAVPAEAAVYSPALLMRDQIVSAAPLVTDIQFRSRSGGGFRSGGGGHFGNHSAKNRFERRGSFRDNQFNRATRKRSVESHESSGRSRRRGRANKDVWVEDRPKRRPGGIISSRRKSRTVNETYVEQPKTRARTNWQRGKFRVETPRRVVVRPGWPRRPGGGKLGGHASVPPSNEGGGKGDATRPPRPTDPKWPPRPERLHRPHWPHWPGPVVTLPPVFPPPVVVEPDPPRYTPPPPRVTVITPDGPIGPGPSGGTTGGSQGGGSKGGGTVSGGRATPPAGGLPPAVPPQLAADEIWPNEVVCFIDIANQPPGTDVAITQAYNLQRISFEENALIGQRLVLYRIPDGRSVAQVAAAMANDPRIALAQPNYRYEASEGALRAGQSGGATPAASKISLAPSSANPLQYALSKIHVVEANKIALGRNITVAVIDSGIDTKHPALAGAIQKSIDLAEGLGIAVDSHGTAIAGIIRARGDVAGVAPATQLLAARAFFRETPGGKAMSSSFILVRALDWAMANGAKVLNLSFSGPADAAVASAIAKVVAQGGIPVAAAGNNGAAAKPAYPAAYPGVIAVTATDPLDKLYANANHGRYIAVSAPGVSVLVLSPNGGFTYDQGTSIAAAHVSGVIAMVLELSPRLGAKEARKLLVDHAVNLGPPGADDQFGAGRVDALAVVTAARVPMAGQQAR